MGTHAFDSLMIYARMPFISREHLFVFSNIGIFCDNINELDGTCIL